MKPRTSRPAQKPKPTPNNIDTKVDIKATVPKPAQSTTMSRNQTPISSPRMAPRRVSSSRKISVNVHSPPPTPTLSPQFSPPERTSSRLSCASNSTESSGASSVSARSSLSQGELQRRRRGFMKPQPTEFSNSARARESVMCLGSIAHLQYFFAKTGLLDGKGGTMMRKKQPGSASGSGSNSPTGLTSPGYLNVDFSQMHDPFTPLSPLLSPSGNGDDDFYTTSPIDDYISDEDIEDPLMKLPPTSSTYRQRSYSLQPQPDPELLRGQLREALAITKRAWESSPLLDGTEPEQDDKALPASMAHLQGAELIELATSAIRAAKAYYYTTDISSTAGQKNDRSLRDDFISVLDALKKMGQSRPFDGRVTLSEKNSVVAWITSVESVLTSEEAQIAEMRQHTRNWATQDWKGREMERNHKLLSYFDPSDSPLPAPASADSNAPLDPANPDPFLSSLQSGLKLILIHNALVRRSKRPFGRIPKFHTDFPNAKPYRPAENLRYWRKAAEIRWEVKVGEWGDVMEVVNGSKEGWEGLRKDVNAWCEKVLAEVRREWAADEQ